MADVPRMLVEYTRLERARSTSGLSAEELQRWKALKERLDRHFSPGSDPTKHSRRRSVRVPTRMKASFESLGSFRESIMTNLSRGGVFVSTDCPLEMGEKVTLRISIEGEGTTLDVPARVVSTSVQGDFSTQRMGMGVAFLDMDPELRRRVDALYERALEAHAERS